MQRPLRGVPRNGRGLPPLRPILHVSEAAARPSSSSSGVGSTATDEDELVVQITATVGVHAVNLTQLSNKSPNGRNNGQSDDPPAGQGRAGLWKSTEEEELKRAWLVFILARKELFPG